MSDRDKELAALQMALGNLKPNMKNTEFIKQATRVQQHYDNVMKNLEKLRGGATDQPAAAGLSAAEQQELIELKKRHGR